MFGRVCPLDEGPIYPVPFPIPLEITNHFVRLSNPFGHCRVKMLNLFSDLLSFMKFRVVAVQIKYRIDSNRKGYVECSVMPKVGESIMLLNAEYVVTQVLPPRSGGRDGNIPTILLRRQGRIRRNEPI